MRIPDAGKIIKTQLMIFIIHEYNILKFENIIFDSASPNKC